MIVDIMQLCKYPTYILPMRESWMSRLELTYPEVCLLDDLGLYAYKKMDEKTEFN